MGMLVIFLAYPTVAQTMFQTFSCTKLAENEEWLDVDFQVDCTASGFQLFEVAAFFGVCIYPVGIPVLTLALLLRNKQSIHEGGPARARYEFLIECYKPEYMYWDCVEMLRKVCDHSGCVVLLQRCCNIASLLLNRSGSQCR